MTCSSPSPNGCAASSRRRSTLQSSARTRCRRARNLGAVTSPRPSPKLRFVTSPVTSPHLQMAEAIIQEMDELAAQKQQAEDENERLVNQLRSAQAVREQEAPETQRLGQENEVLAKTVQEAFDHQTQVPRAARRAPARALHPAVSLHPRSHAHRRRTSGAQRVDGAQGGAGEGQGPPGRDQVQGELLNTRHAPPSSPCAPPTVLAPL